MKILDSENLLYKSQFEFSGSRHGEHKGPRMDRLSNTEWLEFFVPGLAFPLKAICLHGSLLFHPIHLVSSNAL